MKHFYIRSRFGHHFEEVFVSPDVRILCSSLNKKDYNPGNSVGG